jgi:hypothetical protein
MSGDTNTKVIFFTLLIRNIMQRHDLMHACFAHAWPMMMMMMMEINLALTPQGNKRQRERKEEWT